MRRAPRRRPARSLALPAASEPPRGADRGDRGAAGALHRRSAGTPAILDGYRDHARPERRRRRRLPHRPRAARMRRRLERLLRLERLPGHRLAVRARRRPRPLRLRPAARVRARATPSRCPRSSPATPRRSAAATDVEAAPAPGPSPATAPRRRRSTRRPSAEPEPAASAGAAPAEPAPPPVAGSPRSPAGRCASVPGSSPVALGTAASATSPSLAAFCLGGAAVPRRDLPPAARGRQRRARLRLQRRAGRGLRRLRGDRGRRLRRRAGRRPAGRAARRAATARSRSASTARAEGTLSLAGSTRALRGALDGLRRPSDRAACARDVPCMLHACASNRRPRCFAAVTRAAQVSRVAASAGSATSASSGAGAISRAAPGPASPSQSAKSSGATITGIRSWIGASTALAGQVTMAQVVESPRHGCQRPAKARRPPSRGRMTQGVRAPLLALPLVEAVGRDQAARARGPPRGTPASSAIPSARALISSGPPFGARYQGGSRPQRIGTSARSPSWLTQTGTVSVGETFGRASSGAELGEGRAEQPRHRLEARGDHVAAAHRRSGHLVARRRAHDLELLLVHLRPRTARRAASTGSARRCRAASRGSPSPRAPSRRPAWRRRRSSRRRRRSGCPPSPRARAPTSCRRRPAIGISSS